MSFESFPNFNRYKGKNILAVDYGTVATGLATFTPGREPFPQPYGKLKYIDDPSLRRELLQIIEDEAIDIIILGLPFFTDGSESEMTKKVRQFGNDLEKEVPQVQLIFQDETLTSYEAKNRMQNSPRYNFKVDPTQIDALAASIILEDFIKAE